MANVKEFLLDQRSGNVEIEYDDNSVDKFNMSSVASLVSGARIATRAASAPLKWAGRCDRSTALNYTLRQVYLSPVPFWGVVSGTPERV